MNLFVLSEYGQRAVTMKAVDSIQREDPQAVIYIGNDAFPGKTRAATRNPAIRVINQPVNVGYVKNTNKTAEIALLHFGAEIGIIPIADNAILFICNNDIIFHPGSIEKLSQYAAEHDAVVGPTLTIPTHYQLIHPQFRHASDPVRKGEPRPIRMLSGCCLVMRSRIWLDIGGLDEDYHWYYTDDQFCIDAVAKGYESIYMPEAVIDHNVGKTMRRNRAMMRMIREDRELFAKKNPDLQWNHTGEY